MRPNDFVAIPPHIQVAVDDIDYFLNGANELEQAKRELRARYDLLEAGWTPPKVKWRGRHRLTKTQYNALVRGTSVYGNPLTDEKREAILAKLGPGELLSDAEREALGFWARGGWLESSCQAAVWLRNAGKTVAADGIDVALSRLPDEPREATELSGYRDAMRTVAGYVRKILTACLEEQPTAAESLDAKDNQDEDLTAYLPAKTVLEFVPGKFSGPTELKKYCTKTGVPVRNPTPQRLMVHVAKLLESLRSDEPDNEELIGIFERYVPYREERDRLAGK